MSRRMTRMTIGLLTSVALIVLAGPAWPHARLTVESVPAGTVQQLQMRVAEERQGDVTTKVEIQVPQGFAGVVCGQKAGWSCTVDTAGTQPVVTFTRTDPSATLEEPLPFSVRTPAQPGTFAFPTVQTYASGTLVQWIGPQDADEPAPVLATTAGDQAVPAVPPAVSGEEHAQHAEGHEQLSRDEAPTGAGETASTGSAVAAVAVAVGVIALLGGLFVIRRRRST
jgi:LPXTG-motif cell wall-anchored protein